MPDPVILAIETSQRGGGVAVRDRDGRSQAEPLRAELRHDDDLIAAVDRLTQRCGLAPTDLDAVAVSAGPGGFTGLRISISTAKMLGEALRVPLLAIPTAIVAATTVTATGAMCGRRVAVALAIKGEQMWLTRLEAAAGRPERWEITDAHGPPGPVQAERVDLTGLDALLADRFLPAAARRQCESAGLRIIEPRYAASACLSVAARWLEEGRTVDPEALMPIYPREPEAVSLWNRRNRASKTSDN